MARILSGAALRAIFAQNTDEVFLILLTLDHESLSEPVRVVANSEDIVSRGDTFIAYPFTFVLPQDSAERVPQAQLRIDNVDRQIIATLRPLSAPPTVTVQIVTASTPDVVELEIDDLVLAEVDYDVQAISGTLSWDNPLNERFPAGRYTPATAAGLYG